ncbi:hypothetical protein ABIA30_002612 [Mycobacterium sp. MAA66]|jgi:hypothetical protein|uniref:EVE domain-containing protein n=1 Tax=Mycobacterium sp. MAA66 TaxID=3156297 RepID=UPI0035176FAE
MAPHDGRTTWVVVASRDHAGRGLREGFIMANHGKRAPLARMNIGDGIFVYSPKTAFPDGEPFRAIAIVGEITGEAPEPSVAIPGGFRLAASLREISPLPLSRIREHLPVSRLRLGSFALSPEQGAAIWALVED